MFLGVFLGFYSELIKMVYENDLVKQKIYCAIVYTLNQFIKLNNFYV